MTADQARAPVRRATLTLTRAGVGDSRITAMTIEAGSCSRVLPAAVYTLSASKGGFVDMNYGARRLGLPGNPIPLEDAQQFALDPIALVRGAVITGRLLSASQQPLRNVTVGATQVHVIDRQQRRRALPGTFGSSTTDSRGVYRIYGLAAGEYLVSATSPLMFAGNEIRETTADEVRWAQQQTAGRAVPVSAVRRDPAPDDVRNRGRFLTPVPSFYPVYTEPSRATVVKLAAGEERHGVDFSVLHVPTVRIAGTVIGLDGQPVPNANLVRVYHEQNFILPMFGLSGGSVTGPDGRFHLSGVQLVRTRCGCRSSADGPASGVHRTSSSAAMTSQVSRFNCSEA